MEIEALRRQLSDEIAAQFEAKLREAKRQKSQIEEEFEQSSEKWRTERRRLNSEIDRLESALAEARQSGRDFAEARPDQAVDPQEIARLQVAADEKIKEASHAWEKERARLQAEISRLQEGIAELIERTNNPLRSNPVDRGKLEAKYDEAVRARRQVEDAMRAAKAEWETEKRNLTTEAAKIQQSAGPAGATRKVDEQRDNKLKEAVRLQEQLANDLEKARQELSRLKQAHSAELQSITAKLEAEKASLVSEATSLRKTAAQASTAGKSDEKFEKQLQEAIRARDGLAADLEKAKQELARLKETHAAELQNMTSRLQAAKTEWESEKANLAAEVAKLRQSATTAGAAKKGDEQVDKRLQEAIKTRDGLATDLEKAKQELARLKETHAAELQNATGQLQTAKKQWEAEKANLAGEAAKLRQSAAPGGVPKKGDEQLDKRLQETIRTRDGLAADLEKSKHEIAKLKETHSAEIKDFTGRYIQTRTDLEKQLHESEETRGKLERELEKAKQASTQPAEAVQSDGALSEEVSRLKKALDEVQEEKKRLVLRLAETSQRDVVYVKTADGSGNNGGSVTTLEAAAIDEEIKRVEDLTAEIAQLIDNPETELATVIRKNVERAGLEAYLKGILFPLGRGKKL